MTLTAEELAPPPAAIPAARLFDLTEAALAAARAYRDAVRTAIARMIAPGGKVEADLSRTHQAAEHGFAWVATTVEALAQMRAWAVRLEERGELTETDTLLLQACYGEYLNQLLGGIPMSANEFVRPDQFGLHDKALEWFERDAVRALRWDGCAPEVKAALAERLAAGDFGSLGIEDEALVLTRDQIRRFAEDRVAPFAHEWHLKDQLIPLEVIAEMAGLGVFGLTIPEEFGGLGMGKLAMCIVSEELSRAWIGVGSLGTRSEIAAELILGGGTEAQKAHYLPKIADGSILPTAVFTEPNTGSDLGSLRTRAERAVDEAGRDVYRITGSKTWITHAARADLMTMMVRTDAGSEGYRGLSMLLIEKSRGDDANPFPDARISGGEIEVLGYRGMKEYELGFDGFEAPVTSLLGGQEGQGFKQLMRTFESARIQTAARAVGVAQNALELGLAYAQERQQFGRSLIEFPRVAEKLAMMAIETMAARQLTYFAAREKDLEKRCDIEAGMAKLLGARVAWTNADNALQVHGGNGYALEYPISRVLCDARILNIFEGAAEIQAQVVARGLVGRTN